MLSPSPNSWTIIGSDSGLIELNGALETPIGSESGLTASYGMLITLIGSEFGLAELNRALKPPIGSEFGLTASYGMLITRIGSEFGLTASHGTLITRIGPNLDLQRCTNTHTRLITRIHHLSSLEERKNSCRLGVNP
jgi:hypothetical protein